MANELISTPLMTTNGSANFATPESWEMRPEAQTPARHLLSLSTTDQETTPQFGTDGVFYSFSGFVDYDMYETPPGAHLYRDQCGYDSSDMSYQDIDTPGKADSSPIDTSLDGINSEKSALPADSLLQADGEGGQAMRNEPSLLQNEQNHDEVTVNAEVHDNLHHVEDSDINFGNSVLQRSFDTNETDDQQTVGHEVEGCILEQLHRQGYPEEDQFRQAHVTPVAVNELRHLPSDNRHVTCTSPPVESVQDLNRDVEGISKAVLDYPTVEDVCLTSEEKTEHCADYLNTPVSCDESESATKDERIENLEESEIQPHTSSTPPLPENMNCSLLSMGVPQNAQELDQLADFLNMEDPFKKPLESSENMIPDDLCTSQSKDTDDKEPESIPVAHENTVSPSVPSKRKKRRKKVNTVSERRRSVRIARRESLLNTPCDVGDAHVPTEISDDMSSTVPMHDQNSTREYRSAGLQHDHEDQSNISFDSEYVPHPFPEAGEISPKNSTLHCNEIKTTESGLTEGHDKLMVSNEAENFDHLHIDLPMPRKKKKTNNGRRRSIRLLEQDVKLDEGNQAFLQKPLVDGENTVYDSGFLADFADFGLGDNWMPGDMFGESQFAKTPKEKSGRRKSARLSGVPIPLLELTDKSEVKIVGVEEANHSDGPNVADYHSAGDLHVADTAVTTLSETAPMDNVSRDVQGSGCEIIDSLTEFPFERQDIIPLSEKKKVSSSKRRRSVRLIKKPQNESEYEMDPQQQKRKVEISKKATKSTRKGKSVPGSQQDNVLQEMKIMSCDNVFMETQMEGDPFTMLKTPVDDSPMELEDSAEDMDYQEIMVKAKNRISKDTPVMGRKRVSRILEKDKENDDAQAQEQHRLASEDTSSMDRKQKKITPAGKDDDAGQETTAQMQQGGEANLADGSDDNKFRVTNKIKMMYLKKGAALKKHNLETIFESPKKKATGTPVNLLGGRKMKRTVAFVETPWLGRTGRTKGRKVKKGKQVKRVLSSKVEKSWKLDIRLSSLDDPSP